MSNVHKEFYVSDVLIDATDKFGSRQPPGLPLKSGGGGGTFGGMESRVAILETHVEYIRRDLGEMKTDIASLKTDMVDVKVGLATLTERVNHLPSKGYIVTSSLGIVGAIGAIIAFQDHIRAWFGH